ncbi:transporter substrate-binding domain-containing protein [Angustibacter aerolatus]
MLRKVSLVTAALLVGGLAAACGGSDSSSGGSGGSGGALTIGTEGTYAPFSFHDPKTNELTGYDVEIARAVAKQLGKEAKFNEVTFDTIFAGMQAKRFDMIANQVTVNPEREKLYSFSTPYTVSTAVVVTRSDDDSVKTLADVKGKRSPQSATSSFNDFAKAAGAKPYTVEGFTQAVAELKQKRAPITFNDSLAVLDYLKSTGDTSVKIAVQTDDVTKQAFVFRKGDPLAGQVDGALKTLQQNGTLEQISDKYFGQDVSGDAAVGASASPSPSSAS